MHIIVNILLISFSIDLALSDPRVTIEQGTLEGKKSQTDDGKVFYSFQGIPYAKAPIGYLRFQAPQPPERWEGIRLAKKEGNSCKSFDLLSEKLGGDEDCLFLNVYTPYISGNNSLLPVMFWIHGGGFQAGSGNSLIYGPDWLVEQDVVLVTINYRCGIMGFLCLDIPEAAGNAGLKDQVAALRWVNENIKSFGGNPDDITIFGQSAGGASVGYLLLSDSTKGLFKKAISMSGSPLNPWSHITNATHYAFGLCKALGYIPSDEYDALRFLRAVPADDLYSAIGEPTESTILVEENAILRNFVFLPVVEKKFPSSNITFLDQSALHRLSTGQFHNVPIMIGYTNREGLFVLRDVKKDPILSGFIDPKFERYVPRHMCLNDGSKQSLIVSDKIKSFYYGNNSINDIESFIEIKSDTLFKVGIDRTAHLVAERSNKPVFYYVFSFDEFGVTKVVHDDPIAEGATHAEDLGYLFKHKLVNLPRNITDVEITRKRMVKMYTDFARTGNPTPVVSNLVPITWNPIARSDTFFLDINVTLTMQKNPYQKKFHFWDSLERTYSDCSK